MPRITREDEPFGETINDASKMDKSPMKKKSKAGEGKNENENVIKFPIKIMGGNISKIDLDTLGEGQCMTSTVLDFFMKLLEVSYEKEIKEYNILFRLYQHI